MWGGKRERAGRPATGRTRRFYYVTPGEAAEIREVIKLHRLKLQRQRDSATYITSDTSGVMTANEYFEKQLQEFVDNFKDGYFKSQIEDGRTVLELAHEWIVEDTDYYFCDEVGNCVSNNDGERDVPDGWDAAFELFKEKAQQECL